MLNHRKSISLHATSSSRYVRSPASRLPVATQTHGPTASGSIYASSQDRLCIAVDVDEVLGMFLGQLCKYCKDEHGISHGIDEFWIYEFAKIWNCDQETSNHRVHEFFKSEHFRDGIPIIPGSVEALHRMKQEHDLVVVTSRQHVIRNETLEWIDRHYPNVFADVHFGNHFAKSGQSKKKSEICKEIGADVLIDDNPRYAHECASCGMHVLLFNWQWQYPWSRQPPECDSHIC